MPEMNQENPQTQKPSSRFIVVEVPDEAGEEVDELATWITHVLNFAEVKGALIHGPLVSDKEQQLRAVLYP